MSSEVIFEQVANYNFVLHAFDKILYIFLKKPIKALFCPWFRKKKKKKFYTYDYLPLNFI